MKIVLEKDWRSRNLNLQNQTIAWKNVKKSSKGYFINLNGRCYLDEFKVN